MTRRRFSAKARAALFLAARGRCALCGEKITGRWEADHVVPLALGGADTVAQLQVCCRPCHVAKSKVDVARIAKARRCEKKLIPFVSVARKPSRIQSRPFPKVHRPLVWRKAA